MGRPRRLQLFLAEYGWTGPTSAFLEIVAARIQADVTSLRDLAAHDPMFARIVAQGGADALEASLAVADSMLWPRSAMKAPARVTRRASFR